MENKNTSIRIYVPKWMGYVFLGLIPFTVLAIGVALYQYYSPKGFVAPEEQYETLGSLKNVKVSPGASSEKIAEAITQREAHLAKGKLTIIFFYDGYASQQDALTYVEVLKATLDLVEPFRSMKDLIAFKVFTSDGKKCNAEGTPKVLVCDPKLIESFKRLGIDHFKVVLLSPDEFTPIAPMSRGANSWISISTYQGSLSLQQEKRWVGIIFAKLLGKSLGLQPEYADVENLTPVKEAAQDSKVNTSQLYGRPNCAPDKDTAEKWWGPYAHIFSNVSYNSGCGGSNEYFYPVKNTLMSEDPQDQSYGMVSEDYLRGILSCFYGDKESIIFPAGFSSTISASFKSCTAFTKDFPNFWDE